MHRMPSLRRQEMPSSATEAERPTLRRREVKRSSGTARVARPISAASVPVSARPVENQLGGTFLSDQGGQSSTCHRRIAPKLDLGKSPLCIFGGEHHIADHREFCTAAETVPFHGGDRHFLRGHHRPNHRVELGEHVGYLLGRMRSNVDAGRKCFSSPRINKTLMSGRASISSNACDSCSIIDMSIIFNGGLRKDMLATGGAISTEIRAAVRVDVINGFEPSTSAAKAAI